MSNEIIGCLSVDEAVEQMERLLLAVIENSASAGDMLDNEYIQNLLASSRHRNIFERFSNWLGRILDDYI